MTARDGYVATSGCAIALDDRTCGCNDAMRRRDAHIATASRIAFSADRAVEQNVLSGYGDAAPVRSRRIDTATDLDNTVSAVKHNGSTVLPCACCDNCAAHADHLGD